MATELRTDRALELFELAARTVAAAGYEWEKEWQRALTKQPFSEADFLREAAWVVLCSGFREATVRSAFDYVSLCFCDWESAQDIVTSGNRCIETALSKFRSRPKLQAIMSIAETVDGVGFADFKRQILAGPQQTLMGLPYIGPVTWAHLAKNLGLDIAKNDRHLARFAESCGFNDAQSLCEVIAVRTGELVGVVDVILWRFAALDAGNRQPA
ncbi:hypothetical protein [Devosia sp. YR412]|uniref:hypothetical protein n=1 Tax=Devosia sp. YR412 TaxID=1881030 RepID=UPI000B808BA4|nr:hypothetical protein [Devosia sp. YR412]